MKILVVPSWYKTPERPIVGSFFEEQARMLLRGGHQVAIFHPRQLRFRSRFRLGLGDSVQPPDFNDRDLPTYYGFFTPFVPRLMRFNHSRMVRAMLHKGLALVRNFGRPDVIHSHAVFFGGVVALRLAQELRLPLVHTEHLTALVYGDEYSGNFHRKLATEVFEGCNRAIAVGTEFRTDLCRRLDLPPSSIEVIPNVVSPEFFDGFSPKRAERPYIFLTNSFIHERKNHALLLRALRLVVDQDPEVQLRIGGKSYDGSIDQLRKLTEELALQQHVRFLGELSRSQVVEQLRQCDAFVLASRYESFGVVLIEALAMGRPVVATDSGGPRDIVTRDDGRLVKDHAPEPLAQAMLDVLGTSVTFDQRAISERCRSRFSEPVIRRRLEEVYSSAVERSSSA